MKAAVVVLAGLFVAMCVAGAGTLFFVLQRSADHSEANEIAMIEADKEAMALEVKNGEAPLEPAKIPLLVPPIPQGKRAFGIRVRSDNVIGSRLRPLARVDVIHVVKKDDDVKAESVLEDVQVRAIDFKTNGEGSVLVSLIVTPEQVVELARLSEMGTFRLALRPMKEVEKQPNPMPNSEKAPR